MSVTCLAVKEARRYSVRLPLHEKKTPVTKPTPHTAEPDSCGESQPLGSQPGPFKTYIRSTMFEERLTTLALVQCHRKRALRLDEDCSVLKLEIHAKMTLINVFSEN